MSLDEALGGVWPYEEGAPLRIVNASRLWLPPTADGKLRSVPIDMASHCFIGMAGRVERCWRSLESLPSSLRDWRILLTLYGPRPETIISDMPELPGVHSDEITQLVAEPPAVRRLTIVDAIGALEALEG